MASTKLAVTNIDLSPNDPCERIYHEGSANVDQFAIHFNFSGFRHRVSPKSLHTDSKLNNVWVHELDDYGIEKLFLGNVPMQTDDDGKKAFETMFKLKQMDLLDTVLERVEQDIKLDNGRRNIYELSIEEMGRLLYHLVQYGKRKVSTGVGEYSGKFIMYQTWNITAVLEAIKVKYPEEYEVYFDEVKSLRNIKVIDEKWSVWGYESDILLESTENFYTNRCVR